MIIHYIKVSQSLLSSTNFFITFPEKSISSIVMPSSTSTFLAANADSSLASENASQNSNPQHGNGNDLVETKENGKIAFTMNKNINIF